MVSEYIIGSAVSSTISEESTSTIIDGDNNDVYDNYDRNDGNLRHVRSPERYNHVDFEEAFGGEKRDEIIEDNQNVAEETAFQKYSHKDFDKLVQEEVTHLIVETQDDSREETAVETFTHEDFENLVRTEGNGTPSQESATVSYSRGEEVTSETNTDPRSAESSSFVSYSHEDFEKLVEKEAHPIGKETAGVFDEEKNIDNNRYEDVNTFREEVIVHHANNGLENHADVTTQDPFPKVQIASPENPVQTATVTSLPSGLQADEVSVPTVTAEQTIPPDPGTENANFLTNMKSLVDDNQTMATYIAFLLGMVAVGAFFLVVQLVRRRRRSKQKWEVHQYVAKFDIEDIDLRPAITGGWHAQYKNGLAKGHNGDFITYRSDSDEEGYHSSDSGPHDGEKTIVFLEQCDLSSPIPSSKRPLTMQVAEMNMYLEDSTNGADSDNDDAFAPVRTRPF